MSNLISMNKEDIAKAFKMGIAFGFGKKYDEMDKVIEEVKKAVTPRWIPISERLPEDGTWNIFTDGNMMSIERYKADAVDHFYPEGRWFSLDKVIAWMPLPEPYKAESKDKLYENPVDIDKAVEHYEGTLEALKDIDLEVDNGTR